MFQLPPPETALYNHPLPHLEAWLISLGCRQDNRLLNRWTVMRSSWQAELLLDTEQVTVRYVGSGGSNVGTAVVRSFKYSLSRQDVEEAIFAGP
jgi:hypothetical protein